MVDPQNICFGNSAEAQFRGTDELRTLAQRSVTLSRSIDLLFR
jgi:hypothetical protein